MPKPIALPYGIQIIDVKALPPKQQKPIHTSGRSGGCMNVTYIVTIPELHLGKRKASVAFHAIASRLCCYTFGSMKKNYVGFATDTYQRLAKAVAAAQHPTIPDPD